MISLELPSLLLPPIINNESSTIIDDNPSKAYGNSKFKKFH